MGVYVIQPINDGRNVKIGYAKNISQRMSELQIAHSCPLRLVASFPLAGRNFEKYLHKLFNKWHKRGEWFGFNGRLKNLFEAAHNDKVNILWLEWHSIGPKWRRLFLDKIFRKGEIDFLIFWLFKGDDEQKMAIRNIIEKTINLK